MKIKTMLSQHRRDFQAIFECESCGHELRSIGYDDANFHNRVIPNWPCEKCGEKSPDNYQPRTTKYSEGEIV